MAYLECDMGGHWVSQRVMVLVRRLPNGLRRLPVRQLGLAFRLVLSLGLIALLFWRMNLHDALHVFTGANYLYVLPALALFTLSKLVHSIRWRIILQPLGTAPTRGLFAVYLISNMANAFMPVRVGDLLRVQVPAQRYGLPRAGLMSSVFVTETLLDGVTLASFALIGLAFLPVATVVQRLIWALAASSIAGMALALLVARLPLGEGWERERWARLVLPPTARRRLAQLVPQFIGGMRVLTDWRLLARAVPLSFLPWALEVMMFWLFGLAFGLDLRFDAYLLVAVTGNVIVSLPLAPSNIGPYEVAVAEVARALGAPTANAGIFALGSHLFNIFWVGTVGLVAMWALGLGTQDVFGVRGRHDVEPERPPAAEPTPGQAAG